jgi:hypothetical protein
MTAAIAMLALLGTVGTAAAAPVPLGPCGAVDRRHDHVEVLGRMLGGLGKTPVERFTVVAFRDGAAVPIVFELDERRGRKVVVRGPDVEKPDHRPGEFDYDDGIVFMPCDAGEQPPATARDGFMTSIGARAWREVQIDDPLTGRHAFAYVVVADDPPRATARYVEYDPRDVVRTAEYRIGMTNALPSEFSLGGAEGTNLLDGLRLRAELVYLAGLMETALTEVDARHRLLAWHSGAVRAVRRSQHDVHVGLGIHLGAGTSHTYFYPLHVRGPGKMRLPISPGTLFRRVSAMAGVDLHGLEGWQYRGAGAATPLAIDGRTAPEETSFAAQGSWFLMHGDGRAILTALKLSGNLTRALPIRLVFVDDAEHARPPERRTGSVPLVGYHADAIEKLPAGYYEFEFGVFVLPGYRAGDEQRVLEGFGTPLHVSVTARDASAAAPAPPP